ncbi:hypothetical protein PAEH1_03825 [Paenalcaligenes hominis]|uniref:Lipoprotein n=1 Tax=Paenalcaligenes hominis TaxID=643674 RepID=A0A1U9JYS6_9BURK|nr:hypothetical protein [Paenalcaligenes hominis]AQS50916.1 hypothetical protein PAEH1_03825 [Paenalcaligenes hominis]
MKASTVWVGVSLSLFLLSGCGSSPKSTTQTQRYQCKLDPQSCMYEGAYEHDEEAYAEQRAKELNKASARKIKRRGGWW